MRIIAGRWKGHALKPIRGKGIRPTTDRVRESWMSAMGGRMDGLRVLDLFAGSGALGLETLSRGAAHVTFVERSRGSLKVLEANIAHLGAGDDTTVVADDAHHFLRRVGEGAFDVALADPPYQADDAQRLVDAFRKVPFAQELWVEHPWRVQIPLGPEDRTRRYGDTALTLIVATS